MYDTLRPELITATELQRERMAFNPTYVVHKELFFQTAFPYLEVRRPFILGSRDKVWKPTIAHHFARLLHSNTGKLTRVYTQNIDGLANAVDLPNDKIVSVHGSISEVACENCGKGMDFESFCDQVETKIKDIYNPGNGPDESTPICCEFCGRATVKPKTVLFGSSLPEEFFERSEQDLPDADLLIVAGTSLVVGPANSLVYNVPESAKRVIVNNEQVGEDLGIEYGPDAERDFFAKGNCDDVFLDLIHELGWNVDDVINDLPEYSQNLIRMKQKN